MFNKIVAIEPIGLNQCGIDKLKELGKEVKLYENCPNNNMDIISRINDADCVLVSYTTLIGKEVLEKCNGIKYIGMCCSLYDENSANVDIATARSKGIMVTGIRDYGDEGVVAYEISELIRLLHGFGPKQWKDTPTELTREKIGIIGLGTTGLMVARALKALKADVYYYSRTRKIQAEEEGIKYLPLHELLKTVNIVSTNLNKNTVLLYEEEFKLFGDNKILINTTIGPTFSVEALKSWLEHSGNYYLCDGVGIINCEELKELDNVICINKVSGSSIQCTERLSQKVIENICDFLEKVKM